MGGSGSGRPVIILALGGVAAPTLSAWGEALRGQIRKRLSASAAAAAAAAQLEGELVIPASAPRSLTGRPAHQLLAPAPLFYGSMHTKKR
jgi:hypothetical protein